MKAIQIRQFGGPEVLELRDVPTPKPQDRQVLIKINRIGVNFGDVVIREGKYPVGEPRACCLQNR